MYKIRLDYDDGHATYTVEHFVKNDSEPTPTGHTFESRVAAWNNAFGRAAKMSVLLGKSEVVVTDDEREYRVTAKRLK